MGCWKQYELWDGTYTLDDLLDIAELIQVRRENEERAALIRTRTAEPQSQLPRTARGRNAARS